MLVRASFTVLCNGFLRSGSTWSFNVCRALASLQAKRFHQPWESQYLLPDQLDDFLRQRASAAAGPAVIKAHQISNTTLQWIRGGNVKAVCTIRDPRDCVVSDMAFMHHDIRAAGVRILFDLNELNLFDDFGRTLFIRYEDMMKDRLMQIRLIAAYLGVEVDAAAVHAIDKQTNLDASRRVCESLKNFPAERVYITDNHRVDRETQLHENHIGSSKVGRWRHDLPPELGKHLSRLFHRDLLKFGYETEGSLASLLTTPITDRAPSTTANRHGHLSAEAAKRSA
jgi:hypothetical protein